MKYLTISLVLLFSFPISTELKAAEYKLTVADVDSFLSFADSFREMASKHIKLNEKMNFSDVFTELTKKDTAFDAIDKFLKKNNWNFTKLNNFIYQVSIGLEVQAYTKEYGTPKKGEKAPDFISSYPEDQLAIIKVKEKPLRKYFFSKSIDDMMKDLEDKDSKEEKDVKKEEDIEIEKDEKKKNPPDIKNLPNPKR